MKVTTTTNQPECHAVLRELVCEEVFRPTPPIPVCDGILQLADDLWLVGTNDRGQLTLHILEECCDVEAWEFFHNLRGGNNRYLNPRISFVGPSVPVPEQN